MDKNKKQKTENETEGWDGITDCAKDRWVSYPERIAQCLLPKEGEKKGIWWSHRAIKQRLRGQGTTKVLESLSTALLWLVRHGYLERAKKPLKEGERDYGDYIYRRTDKPYTLPGMGDKMKNKPTRAIQRGYSIYQSHSNLPKWFRDMM